MHSNFGCATFDTINNELLNNQTNDNMTTQQALDFALETIKNAKIAMIQNGYVSAELIFGTCKKLAAMLDLPFDLVVLAFEKA